MKLSDHIISWDESYATRLILISFRFITIKYFNFITIIITFLIIKLYNLSQIAYL